MRIKALVVNIIFLACFKCANAQELDTFYVVSQYRIFGNDERDYNTYAGQFPMEVYLPNNQQVTLFAKELGKWISPAELFLAKFRKLHCLRIIKQRDSLLKMRIVSRDSIRRKSKHILTFDTILTITDMPFYRNVFTASYGGGNNPFNNPSKMYISNRPGDLAYLPQNQKKKRKRFLNRFLQNIQYEYNAVTDKLTQLY